MTRSKQHSHQVTVPLLLEYIGGVQWHIIASYDTAQKAAVSYLLRLVNGGSGPVKTASAGYAAEGGKIGEHYVVHLHTPPLHHPWNIAPVCFKAVIRCVAVYVSSGATK